MPARPGALSVHVTPREAEILDLLAQGFSNAEIGVAMKITTDTVKHHIVRPENSWTFTPAFFWPSTGAFPYFAWVPAWAPAGRMASSYRKIAITPTTPPSTPSEGSMSVIA